MDHQKTDRDKIRERFLGLSARAPTSKAASIRLFCIECCGGSRNDAASCATRECFLWPHAFGRAKQK